MSMDLRKLNKYCLHTVREYKLLNIYGKKVAAPYFMNIVERLFYDMMRRAEISESQIEKLHKIYKSRIYPFAWFRGKGSPTEISSATMKISKKVGINLHNASPSIIREFMKLYGLGIDCSGFVYQVLWYAFNRIGELKIFKNSLNWEDRRKQTASRAGVFVFTKNSSIIIPPKNVRELDLIIIKSKEYTLDHIALILTHNNELIVTQSVLNALPTGVNISEYKVGVNPRFSFKPETGLDWEKLYKLKRLEFRRLKILNNNNSRI